MDSDEDNWTLEQGTAYLDQFIKQILKFLNTGELEKTHSPFIKSYT